MKKDLVSIQRMFQSKSLFFFLLWLCMFRKSWIRVSSFLNANETQMFIKMSLFLYLLNMATIIRVSYPEKSNRVQSRSCHVSLIKLDIVAIKIEINEISISLLLSWQMVKLVWILLETFLICFAKYHCILDLNATCLVCKAFLIHTFSLK